MKPRMSGEDRRKKLRRIWKAVRSAVLLIAAAYLLVTYVVQRVDVYGDSMSPMLNQGDVLLIDKLTMRIRKPRRFEMVVFRYRYRDNLYYIKRIIGLPGETVQIIDGKILIDGVVLEETFGTEPIEKGKRAEEPVVLGKDEYFVLGDNRNHSSDSRDSDIGNLKKEEIIGRAVLRIWPFERAGLLGN